MKRFLILSVLGSTLTSTLALAKISVSETQPVQIPQAQSTEWNKEDVKAIIPTDMKASDDPNFVASRIGDRALNSWLNSPAVKNSSLGHTADTVNNRMKTEVALKTDDRVGAVEHKFSFQVLAFQAMTQVKYSGWLNAALNYDARANETVMEITQKLWSDKNFVLSHTANSQQDLSAVGLRWNW